MDTGAVFEPSFGVFLIIFLGLAWVWGPYLDSTAGQYLRPTLGPWMVNFPKDMEQLVYWRDGLLTLGFVPLLLYGGLFGERTLSLPFKMFIAAAILAGIGAYKLIDAKINPDPETEQLYGLIAIAGTLEEEELVRDLGRNGGLLGGGRYPYLLRHKAGAGYLWIADAPLSTYGGYTDPETWEQLAKLLGTKELTLLAITTSQGLHPDRYLQKLEKIMRYVPNSWRYVLLTDEGQLYSRKALNEAWKAGRSPLAELSKA